MSNEEKFYIIAKNIVDFDFYKEVRMNGNQIQEIAIGNKNSEVKYNTFEKRITCKLIDDEEIVSVCTVYLDDDSMDNMDKLISFLKSDEVPQAFLEGVE